VSSKIVKLDALLADFPVEINDWTSTDIAISDTVLKAADNDDYLIREYKNSKTGQSVNLYISYSARPTTMRGHKPENCYPGGGWVLDDSKNIDVDLDSGRILPCLIHSFHKRQPYPANIFVLNYYILDGRLITHDEEFSGLRYRLVNNTTSAKRYVTQVQVSSTMTNSVLSATSEFADLIFKYFPVTNGTK
jgi:EpsI family protein